MTFGTFDSLHSKCNNTPCQGPGCRIRRNYGYSTAAPRVKTRLRKPERRLEARIKGWEFAQTGAGKPEHGQQLHRPGSQH